MTFDLTPELETVVREASQVSAAIVAPAAAAVDATGAIPDDVRAAAGRVVNWGQSPLAAVLAIEELAVASASVAASAGLAAPSSADGLAGLRGVAPIGGATVEQHLGMAAVCVGIGRAAVGEAVTLMKQRSDRPSGAPEDVPHWALADAATDVEAARLLVRASAQGTGPGAEAALVLAGAAATRAVDAALRILGPEAFRPGTILERCSRDARAALLLLGTEDQARRQAAGRLLG